MNNNKLRKQLDIQQSLDKYEIENTTRFKT